MNDNRKQILGFPFQIIEPEDHGRYFHGDFIRRLKTLHRVMRVSTYKRRERRLWYQRIYGWIPGIRSGKWETYTVITDDDSVETGEPYLFTLQPIDLDMMYVAEKVRRLADIENRSIEEGDIK